MLNNRPLGMNSPRPTLGRVAASTPAASTAMIGLGLTPKGLWAQSRGSENVAQKSSLQNASIGQQATIDKENDSSSVNSNRLSKEPSGKAGTFMTKNAKKRSSRRRSSIGELEALPAIRFEDDAGDAQDAIKEENPNDVSALMTFEEMDMNNSSPAAPARSPKSRTPMRKGSISSNKKGKGGTNFKVQKEHGKRSRASISSKKKMKSPKPSIRPPPPPGPPTDRVAMHTLLMSPSLVTTASTFATPLRHNVAAPVPPARSPSSDDATESDAPISKSDVTPENFNNFLDGVKTGIQNDASELWSGFQRLFGYNGIGLTSFNGMHTNNNTATFSAEEVSWVCAGRSAWDLGKVIISKNPKLCLTTSSAHLRLCDHFTQSTSQLHSMPSHFIRLLKRSKVLETLSRYLKIRPRRMKLLVAKQPYARGCRGFGEKEWLNTAVLPPLMEAPPFPQPM